MRPLIIISIYILIPLLTSFFYKRLRLNGFVLNLHLITGLLIFIFPYFLLKFDDWNNPPDPNKSGCSMPILGPFIGNTIFMIPITQGLLFLFNWYFKNYKQNKQTLTGQENKNVT
jgi:hypothetical protein